MCFLAGISNSNVSNEPEKWSDWERLGISKLKNNPNLKEANEGVPHMCMLGYFTLQNKQAAVPVEFTGCNVPYSAGAGLCHSVSLLSFPVFSHICSPFLSFTSSVQLGSHYLTVMGRCSYHLPLFYSNNSKSYIVA